MLAYVTIGTNDTTTAFGFYDEVLSLLGVSRLCELGDKGALFGSSDPQNPQMIAVMKPYDGNDATVGNGMMVALAADKPGSVDAVHARALKLGGTNEGDPGVRNIADLYPDVPDLALYIAYFRDLDGNKIAVCCPAG